MNAKNALVNKIGEEDPVLYVFTALVEERDI